MIERWVTSFELSKRLCELGVKQDSLFYWYKGDYKTFVEYEEVLYADIRRNHPDLSKIFSAFTTSELSVFMPHSYEKDGKSHYIETASYTLRGEYVSVCSSHFYFNEDDGCAIVGDDFDGEGNEANARAKMLIFLLEKKLVVP